MHYFLDIDGNNALQGLYNRVWQKLGINYLLVTLIFLYLSLKRMHMRTLEKLREVE